jgi:Cdc6-like AAA superfamily ATPase
MSEQNTSISKRTEKPADGVWNPQKISLLAANVFRPTTPINRREFFAGRLQQIQSAMDVILQSGQHAVIYGEAGVGKTSLANIIRPFLFHLGRPDIVIKVNATTQDDFASLWTKAFEETAWKEMYEGPGLRPETQSIDTNLREKMRLSEKPSPDEIRRCLSQVPKTVFIFDEFDRLPRPAARLFTDLIKMLSDFEVDSTIILVGVAQTIEQLVRDHASIRRALVQIPMPRMSRPELLAILETAAKELGMEFQPESAGRIAYMSQGLPHYVHLLGLHSVRRACARSSKIVSPADATEGTKSAVASADATITSKYSKATHSAHKDALYRHVLLACALSKTDGVGMFQLARVTEPMTKIVGKSVDIANFSRHIAEFCLRERGAVLEVSGQERKRRYRFRDPLLPPYVIMKGIDDDLIAADAVNPLL